MVRAAAIRTVSRTTIMVKRSGFAMLTVACSTRMRHALTGGIVKQIDDVDTDAGGAPTVPSGSGWSNTSGLNLTTTMIVDSLGRATKVHDPNGNDTYTVYLDTAHERRVYPGFSAGATTGPIQVEREYRPTGTGQTLYVESMTVAVSPSLNGSSLPSGLETFSASDIRSLSRSLTNNAGQVVERDEFFSMSGLTYSQSSAYMSATASDHSNSGNYHATLTDFDTRGLRFDRDPSQRHRRQGRLRRIGSSDRGLGRVLHVGAHQDREL